MLPAGDSGDSGDSGSPEATQATRRHALRRLAARVGILRLELAAARERVARVGQAEHAAGSWQRLPRAALDEARAARWELQRLRAELVLAREEFERLRARPPGRP
jgi:hypothetical protein